MKNIELLKKTIAEDCKVSGQYWDEEQGYGQTCVLGALARVAGVSRHVLVTAGTLTINHPCGTASQVKAVVRIARAIHATFGLTAEQQRALQRVNDSNCRAIRAKRVLECLELIETLTPPLPLP